MKLDVSIIGTKELLETFGRLPRTTRTNAVRPALREGASILRDMAETNVKLVAIKGYATHTLEKNIRYYNLRDFKGMARVAVAVRRGAVNTKKIVNGQPVRVGLYAAVLEYGKKNQPPASWIRKAAREGESAASQAVFNVIGKRIEIAVQKARKR